MDDDNNAVAMAQPEITPEILTVIQTAAAVFITRRMKTEKPQDKDSGSWSHQGREIVQSSHNLVQRGH